MRLSTRRDAMGRAASVVSALAAGPLPAQPPPEPSHRLKVVVTGGHPGDPEYGCGGTVARYTDLGHEVVLLYLNQGEPTGALPKSPRGTRAAEAKKACAILKARPLFAGQVDGESVVDRAHYAAFRKIMEDERPDAVFTHWPVDNHADHRAMSMLVYDAWLRAGKSYALYYYEVSNGEDTVQFSPTHHVDITNTAPRKRLACFAHASQTPERFYALQEQVSRFRGVERGVALAEGFTRHVQSPDVALPFLT
jgi:LmbE family N-acetylglucosaminyl deacetylase